MFKENNKVFKTEIAIVFVKRKKDPKNKKNSKVPKIIKGREKSKEEGNKKRKVKNLRLQHTRK